MPGAQAGGAGEGHHDLPGIAMVAADEHVAIDIVFEVVQMFRRDVLERRDDPDRGAKLLLQGECRRSARR